MLTGLYITFKSIINLQLNFKFKRLSDSRSDLHVQFFTQSCRVTLDDLEYSV